MNSIRRVDPSHPIEPGMEAHPSLPVPEARAYALVIG
jgi:hypothetical protein